MVIFYHKTKGDIIASFPEAFHLSEKIRVTIDNEPATNIDSAILLPIDAHVFNDPRHPANIHDFHVIPKKMKIQQFRNQHLYTEKEHALLPHIPLKVKGKV